MTERGAKREWRIEQSMGNDLTDAELRDIDARAAAASDGPWRVTFAKGEIANLPEAFVETDDNETVCRFDEYANDGDNAAHIAGLDPQTVRRMVAELQRRRRG